MKFFWVDATIGASWDERKRVITTGLESGAKGALVRQEDVERAAKLGDMDLVVAWHEGMDAKEFTGKRRVLLVGKGGEGDGTLKAPHKLNDSLDLRVLKELKSKGARTCGYVEITSKDYETLAVMEASQGSQKLQGNADFIIVVGKDWTVIPMENIIAELQKEKVEVMAGIRSAEEAKLALETLEVGVDGVLLQTTDVNEIKKVASILAKGMGLVLKPAEITKLKQVGMGDRVCVDTASMLTVGEGMLVGSQAGGLFLVHSETLETEYVASRPFRVNAGAVHAYVMGKDGKTKYLSELTSGDEVMVVDAKGNTRAAVVGRVKIEKRPLILVEAECEGAKFRTLLQNAETITLVGKDGRPVSIAKLKVGDEVLVHASGTGRHFGMAVEESVIEK